MKQNGRTDLKSVLPFFIFTGKSKAVRVFSIPSFAFLVIAFESDIHRRAAGHLPMPIRDDPPFPSVEKYEETNPQHSMMLYLRNLCTRMRSGCSAFSVCPVPRTNSLAKATEESFCWPCRFFRTWRFPSGYDAFRKSRCVSHVRPILHHKKRICIRRGNFLSVRQKAKKYLDKRGRCDVIYLKQFS